MQGVRPVQAAGRHVPLSQTLGSSANASIAPAPLFCSSRGVAVNPGHCAEARAAGTVAAQPPPLHHFLHAPPCIFLRSAEHIQRILELISSQLL